MSSAAIDATPIIPPNVHIPPELSAILKRPDPLPAPPKVLENGTLISTSIQVNGLDRSILYYVPKPEFLARHVHGDIPLLIAFHGATERAEIFRASSSSYAYDQLAYQEGFIIAYPDGYKGVSIAPFLLMYC